MVEWGDVATWVSGVGTVGALAFAAEQVRGLRSDRSRRDQVELEGVSVTWRAERVEFTPNANGRSSAVYVFTAHNPGQLPIKRVSVRFRPGVGMVRKHSDGSVEPEAEELVMSTPLLAGGSKREWRRSIEIDYAARSKMKTAEGSISFWSPLTNHMHTNEWTPPD